MTDDELTAEHAALVQQTAELQREHHALHDAPDPTVVLHAEHSRRLQQKIAELRAHMARLQAQRNADDGFRTQRQ